jgi:hypothetical protein
VTWPIPSASNARGFFFSHFLCPFPRSNNLVGTEVSGKGRGKMEITLSDLKAFQILALTLDFGSLRSQISSFFFSDSTPLWDIGNLKLTGWVWGSDQKKESSTKRSLFKPHHNTISRKQRPIKI